MAAKLPEELLREVLSATLHVSEQDFADAGPTSPFRFVTRSGSDLLLVSKRWMRVATPELYRMVILRSSAQSKRLSQSLRSNPELGSHVRQMRIEGAYGDTIRHIAARCPSVVDICISLRIWYHDNASGLVAALAQLNPTRVVLTLAPEFLPSNRQHDELLDALCKYIKTWSSLRVFKFAGSHIRHSDGPQRPDFIVYRSLMSALQTASSLQDVVLSLGPGLYSARNSELMMDAAAATESLLIAHPSVRVTFYRIDMRLEGGRSMYRDADLTDNEDIILRSNIAASLHSRLVRLSPRAQKSPPHSCDHSTQCLMPFNCTYNSLGPSARATIFSRIVRYAIEVPRRGYVSQDFQVHTWADLDGIDIQSALALQLTNRDLKFYSLAVLIRQVLLSRKLNASSLVHLLDRYPSLAGSIRSITFGTGISAQSQADIISRTTSLNSVHGVSASGTLPLLVEKGISQGLLHLGIASLKGTPLRFDLPLQHFAALTSLLVDVEPRFRTVQDSNSPVIQISSLTKLTVESCSTSIINMLQRAILPNLELLNIRALGSSPTWVDDLIKNLGQTLRHALVPDIPTSLWTCTPHLVVLDVFDGFSAIESVYRTFESAHHPTLRTMRFHCPLTRLPLGGTPRKIVIKALVTYMSREKFDLLDSVQFCLGFKLWPTDAHAERGSPWPERAELLAQQGIRLLDWQGVEWRQRLK